MPPHRIAPPQLPEYTSAEVAAMLPPMPVSDLLRSSYQRESNEAMRMVKEVGLPIRSDYRFQTQPA